MTTIENSTEIAPATETLRFAVEGSELVARCGTFEARTETPSALLSAVWDAVELDRPAEIEPDRDGYPSYEAALTLGGVELCRARCWLLCGWLSRGASQDLDGSGLASWGNSQPGGWSVCESDGSGHGLTDLGDAYEDALREAAKALLDGMDADDPRAELASDLEDEIEGQGRMVRDNVNPPKCPEPDAAWVALKLERERTLAKIGDAEIKAGCLLGHVVLVCEATDEFVVDPDEDDVERIAEKLVTKSAKRDGEWASELQDLAGRLQG